jgi:hypothetical protein
MDGCKEFARMLYFIICWYVFIIIGAFLGLRECPSFLIFVLLFFAFWRLLLVSGSALGHIASLEGVCWNIRRLCERAQCAAIPGIFLILIVFFHSSGCRSYLSFSPFIL